MVPLTADLFLKRVSLALSPLDADERGEIIAELRSHLADRKARGEFGAAELLREFGEPEAYASQFIVERSLRSALASGSSVSLGRALLSGVGDSFLALGALVPLAFTQLFALALVVCAVAKVFAPSHVGLFVDAAGSMRDLGLVGAPGADLREVLGWWSLPLFLLVGTLLFWSANRVMRGLVRWRLRRLPRGV